MLILYCLVAHSIVINRRPTMSYSRQLASRAVNVPLLEQNPMVQLYRHTGMFKFAGYVPVKNV